MSKPRKRKAKQKYTILDQPAYWRLKAELLAIRDFLGTAYLNSVAHSVGTKLDTKDYAEHRRDFEKSFNEVVAFHHGKLLEALENLSPELAAELDNRGLDEVDTH